MSYDVNSLEAHWMPFSANRDFKANPRMVVKSEGMYMWDYKGGQIIGVHIGGIGGSLFSQAFKLLPRRVKDVFQSAADQ